MLGVIVNILCTFWFIFAEIQQDLILAGDSMLEIFYFGCCLHELWWHNDDEFRCSFNSNFEAHGHGCNLPLMFRITTRLSLEALCFFLRK
jgi:hypothetical protein